MGVERWGGGGGGLIESSLTMLEVTSYVNVVESFMKSLFKYFKHYAKFADNKLNAYT